MAKFQNMKYHKSIISIEQLKHYFVDFPNKQNCKIECKLIITTVNPIEFL